jgi:DNA-binding LytR/AlgR family response regulator
LLVSDIIKQFNTKNISLSPDPLEELIRIGSQLKKEELTFFPGQLIYAEADGNYIVFHLNIEDQIKKKIIRNSISNIEQQLSAIPFFFRTHRAYIVNLKKVCAQKGNTLGYRLKLSGTDIEIPVSRQKTRDFDLILERYH